MITPDHLKLKGFIPDGKGGWYKPKRQDEGSKDSGKPSSPEPKPSPQVASHEGGPNKAPHPGKCLVRITCFRINKQDPDNGVYKFHIDAIRRAGLIADDTEDAIELEVAQVKVSTKAEERTEIILIKP